MTEHDKKYWKRVYLYFGNDMQAWCKDDGKFHREYIYHSSFTTYFPEYFDTDDDTGNWKFTDKFLEEVMTW